MDNFAEAGKKIRDQSKDLVLKFMQQSPECSPNAQGLKQAVLFKECGFDWGPHEKASSSNQQYWFIAILRQLEQEQKVRQVKASGPWVTTGAT